MYDIKQFRPALYFVLILGMTAFGFAVESAALWILSVGIVVLHIWLVRTDRFRPLPRMLANAVTLIALLVTFAVLRTHETGTPIVIIGQFLVFLQLVKLFELRANRDYAQLLVLSLLLMVAGAISTPSLLFAVMFAVYFFCSLYVCLLFHLKIENEGAVTAQTLPGGRLNEPTVRQDQRYLPRSMRRLAALVSVTAVAMAVLVFLFFPRGAGANMFGQLQLQPAALTGISNEITFTNVTNIAQNNEIVAHVQLYKNGQLVQGTQPLLLRGQALSVYNRPKWTRGHPGPGDPGADQPTDPYFDPHRNAYDELRAGGDVYLQKVSLRPTNTRMLFALPGVIRFTPPRSWGRVRYSADDDTLAAASREQVRARFDYEVESRNAFIEPSPIERVIGSITRTARGGGPGAAMTPADRIPPQVAEYARRPEVTGTDAQGRSLAGLRPRELPVSDLDQQIAANIERHLRTTFGYTLDLTDQQRDEARDPNEQFLVDWKKGHCEYFASSMVLMCQSLGMQARLVTGFKCDEYDPNPGQYYVVRQSHAHAWVEVRTAAGWQTFDPTSGNDAGGGRGRTALQAVKHFFDWLDFKWAEKVVAYDADRRENLISNVDRAMVNTILSSRVNPNKMPGRLRAAWQGFMGRFDDWLNAGGWLVGAKVILGLIVLLAGACCVVVLKFVAQRRRMRKRAARIGLDNLPTAEQIRLARQLGFYEHLTTLLERRRIVRPRHQTPAEFSDSLSFLPNHAFDTIRRLTQVFYAIRFGRRQLDQDEQRDLESTVDTLEPILDHAVPMR
jgi:transglutaminase-like putative cysteine protease